MFKLSKQSISNTIATILAVTLAKQSSSNQQSKPLASGVPHTAAVYRGSRLNLAEFRDPHLALLFEQG